MPKFITIKLPFGDEEEHHQLLLDTLTNWVEGGPTYWCSFKSISRNDEREITRAKIIDDDGGDAYTITPNVILKGIKAILNHRVGVREDILTNLAGAVVLADACDIDFEIADCIVQAAIFNDIVYG